MTTAVLIDVICYLALVGILIVMTRVKPCSKVQLKIQGQVLSGTFLFCKVGLSSRVGLLNTPALHRGDGILLAGAKSVHTVGMHYPIDLVFLDESGRILKTQAQVNPGERRCPGPKGTRSILELGAGTLAQSFAGLPDYAVVEVIHG